MNHDSISLDCLQKIKPKQSNPTQARTVKVLVTRVWLFVIQWIVACQAPLSMGFFSKNTGVGSHPFSRGSSWLRNRTGVSCVAGGFFTNWATTSQMCFPLLDLSDSGILAHSVGSLWVCKEASSLSCENAQAMRSPSDNQTMGQLI